MVPSHIWYLQPFVRSLQLVVQSVQSAVYTPARPAKQQIRQLCSLSCRNGFRHPSWLIRVFFSRRFLSVSSLVFLRSARNSHKDQCSGRRRLPWIRKVSAITCWGRVTSSTCVCLDSLT